MERNSNLKLSFVVAAILCTRPIISVSRGQILSELAGARRQADELARTQENWSFTEEK